MNLPKEYISYSQIRLYQSCPKKYYYTYIEEKETPINDKIYLGIIFHSVVECYLREKIQVMKDHYTYSVEYKGEKKGVLEMRKHISGYLKGLPNISTFRSQLIQDLNLEQVLNKLDEIYEYYSKIEMQSVIPS